MRVLGDFRLKTLLDRIAEEIKQLGKESHPAYRSEYDLTNSVSGQEESDKAIKESRTEEE